MKPQQTTPLFGTEQGFCDPELAKAFDRSLDSTKEFQVIEVPMNKDSMFEQLLEAVGVVVKRRRIIGIQRIHHWPTLPL